MRHPFALFALRPRMSLHPIWYINLLLLGIFLVLLLRPVGPVCITPGPIPTPIPTPTQQFAPDPKPDAIQPFRILSS